MKLTKPFSREPGFTLIEALIAFVVMTVGILGALLFHSQVLRDSAESKAQVEALKLAEQYIERQRAAVYSNFTGLSTALNSLYTTSQSSVSGTNATYDFVFSQPSLVSGSDSTLEQLLTVSWDDGNSISLSSFYSWVDPKNTLPADEVDDGSGGDYDNSQIPVPTGTLEIIAREELQVVGYEGETITPTVEGGQVGTYVDSAGDTYIVIDLGGDKVRVAKLSDDSNEIMTISGKIYNNWSGAYKKRRLNLPFGYVYKREEVVDGTLETVAADDKIIDIRATGGAVCVIDDDFVNVTEDSVVYGVEATYICVAGTGWNGTIYPYKKDSTAGSLSDFDLQESTGGLVCAPRQRSYRYILLSVDDSDNSVVNLKALETYVNSPAPNLTITEMISNASASQVGQSGLVRFTSSATPSGEKVSWDTYFWHNPEYIVPPTAVASAGLDLRPGATSAEEGYKVPSYTSSAIGSYSINLPGDLAYQNFILAEETAVLWDTDRDRQIGGSSSTWDCSDVYSYALNTFASGAYSADRLDHEYFMARGMLGYKAAPSDSPEVGYIPASSGYPSSYTIEYSVDDYNKFEWTDKSNNATPEWSPDSRGSIVLGYALATERVGGRLVVPNGTDVMATSFELGGNPEPVISINCDPDTVNGVSIGDGKTEYPFTCSVPANWEGTIVAFDTDAVAGCSLEVTITDEYLGQNVSQLADILSENELFALSVFLGEFGTVSNSTYSFIGIDSVSNVKAGDELSTTLDLDITETCN